MWLLKLFLHELYIYSHTLISFCLFYLFFAWIFYFSFFFTLFPFSLDCWHISCIFYTKQQQRQELLKLRYYHIVKKVLLQQQQQKLKKNYLLLPFEMSCDCIGKFFDTYFSWLITDANNFVDIFYILHTYILCMFICLYENPYLQSYLLGQIKIGLFCLIIFKYFLFIFLKICFKFFKNLY